MRAVRYLAIAMIAASSGLGIYQVQAQSLSSVQAPAEFPPDSYTGRQYVDSKGCVFVRAGIDGNVTWVPRVSRDRKVICGFQPSTPGQVAEVSTAPETDEETVMVTPSQEDPGVSLAIAQPQEVQLTISTGSEQANIIQPSDVAPVQAAAPAPAPAKPKPVKVVSIQPQIMTQPEQMAPRQSNCRGASEISGQYLATQSGVEVRCGPQTTPHVTIVRKSSRTTEVRVVPVSQAGTSYGYAQPVPLNRETKTIKLTKNTRVVPRKVYQNQVLSTRGVYVPEGYKPVWDDDRLNPKRAHQTLGGRAQMEMIWTNTVPRQLIVEPGGRNVEDHYLDQGVTSNTTTTISTRGTVKKQPATTRVQSTTVRKATVATRSAAQRTHSGTRKDR